MNFFINDFLRVISHIPTWLFIWMSYLLQHHITWNTPWSSCFINKLTFFPPLLIIIVCKRITSHIKIIPSNVILILIVRLLTYKILKKLRFQLKVDLCGFWLLILGPLSHIVLQICWSLCIIHFQICSFDHTGEGKSR